MKRRQFIHTGALALGPLLVPSTLLDIFRHPAAPPRTKVFIHLEGGNDWYNMFIPLEDAEYYRQRSSLAISKGELVVFNENFGLNPFLNSFSKLYSLGNLTYFDQVRTVGTDISHHHSVEAWRKAFSIPLPDAAFESISLIEQLYRIADQMKASPAGGSYSAVLDGFDTHQFQRYRHDLLLKEFSQSIDAFVSWLKEDRSFSETLIVVWSEFGRSLKENAARGTDHGNHNALLLIGGDISGLMPDVLKGNNRLLANV